MEHSGFWLAMAMAALAIGLHFAARKKQRRWAQERRERWEAFKEKQGIR